VWGLAMIDVMFYEAFEEEEKAIKKLLPSHIRAQFTWKTIQEQKDKTPPSELISIRTQSCIPKDWAKSIKGVLTRSQGYDHLLRLSRETETDLRCGYLGSYCSRAVAEQAILMMMALFRKLRKQLAHFKTFSRDGLTGLECRGRGAFVVGVGNIGSEIVDIVKGLRMHVKGFDKEQRVKDLSYVSLTEGAQWADVVFCALPLTKETNGMLDYRVFQSAKQGLVFINISRGEISPISDLKKLLDEKILGGISLDVFSQESKLANSLRDGENEKISSDQAILDFLKNDQVIFTPHNAFNTREALEKKASVSVEAVVSYLKKGSFPYPIPSV